MDKILILISMLTLIGCGQQTSPVSKANMTTPTAHPERIFVAGDSIAYKPDFGSELSSKTSATIINIAHEYSTNVEASILAQVHLQELAAQNYKASDAIVASFGILEIQWYNIPLGCGLSCGDPAVDYQNVAGGEDTFRGAVSRWIAAAVSHGVPVIIAEIPYNNHPNTVTDRYRAVVADEVAKSGSRLIHIVKNPRPADIDSTGFPTQAERTRITDDIAEVL